MGHKASRRARANADVAPAGTPRFTNVGASAGADTGLSGMMTTLEDDSDLDDPDEE